MFILYHISPGGSTLCAFPQAPILTSLPYGTAGKEPDTKLTFGFHVSGFVRVTAWGCTVGWAPEDQWEREERVVWDWGDIGKGRGG